MPASFLHIDDCVNHTCANGGLCVDGVNSYSCSCSAGYTGERCLTGRWKVWHQYVINNNINKHIYVPCITLKFAIKTKVFDRLQKWILCRHSFLLLTFFVVMVVVTRSLAEESTIMTNTSATTFSSIMITRSLKDVLLSSSNSAFTSAYTQQQEESTLLTITSSAALSSSVFKATTSRSMPPSTKEREAGIQHKAKVVSQGHIWLLYLSLCLVNTWGCYFTVKTVKFKSFETTFSKLMRTIHTSMTSTF